MELAGSASKAQTSWTIYQSPEKNRRDPTSIERRPGGRGRLTPVPYLIYIALLGWIPLTLGLFAFLPPSRAVAAGVVGGWLLLPPASIPVSGLPDYDKAAAISIGIILATLIFQPNRLISFRARWFDALVIGWCFCPFMSSLQNGLGIYDGLASLLVNLVRWACPYAIGRLYLDDFESFREFARGLVVWGMIYTIPTVFEIRMSPILRLAIYGMGGRGNMASLRFGGYRPFVFLTTGLEHALWMTVATLLAYWLWRCGAIRRIGPFPMGQFLLPFLFIVTFSCRSSGALFLLIAGLIILRASTAFRSKVLVYLLLLVAPAYYAVRLPGLWSGEDLVGLLRANFSEERAESLAFRFRCEDMLAAKALQRPVWGWASWGRNRLTSEDGRDLAPTDGMWIIHLGQYGLVGLFAWTALGLVPALRFVRHFPVERWTDPLVGPAAVASVILGLNQVDNLLNGFQILPLMTVVGGLIGLPDRSPLDRRSLGMRARDDADLDPGPTSPPDPKTTRAKAHPDSPQVEMAERYLNLARSLRAGGSNAEVGVALIHARNFLAAVHPADLGSPATWRRYWDCTNDLAWLLLNREEPSTESRQLAAELAAQATEADPGCGTYWNTLGAALYKIGDATGCIDAIERSIALSEEGTAFDYLYFALCHARLGHEHFAHLWHSRARSWIEEHGARSPDLIGLDKEAVECIATSFARD